MSASIFQVHCEKPVLTRNTEIFNETNTSLDYPAYDDLNITHLLGRRHPVMPNFRGGLQLLADCYGYVKNLDCSFYKCINRDLYCMYTFFSMDPHVFCLQDGEPTSEWIDELVKCYMRGVLSWAYTQFLDVCDRANDALLDIEGRCLNYVGVCEVGWDNRHKLYGLFRKAHEHPANYYYYR
ncbi:hypothetical protein Ahia01_001099100 [Argonauta hians]